MLDFREVSINDKEWMEPLLKNSGYISADSAFGTLYIWANGYNIKICRYKDFIMKQFGRDEVFYSFPIGNGDLKVAIFEIIYDANIRNIPVKFSGLTKSMATKLEEVMPGAFEFKNNRDIADYIYNSEDLAFLKGKKYHSKRNHVSNFIKNYKFEYKELSDYSLDSFIKLSKKWFDLREDNKEDGIEYENESLQRAIAKYRELDFTGAVVEVDSSPVAMIMGEEINSNAFLVHFEKALTSYKGSYAFINKEFSLRNLTKYSYINREEDMGIEGLRKAKLSYHPEILLEKYIATLKGGIG